MRAQPSVSLAAVFSADCWGLPVYQDAGSRRDPPVDGPQLSAEKPAGIDTDGWAQAQPDYHCTPGG